MYSSVNISRVHQRNQETRNLHTDDFSHQTSSHSQTYSKTPPTSSPSHLIKPFRVIRSLHTAQALPTAFSEPLKDLAYDLAKFWPDPLLITIRPPLANSDFSQDSVLDLHHYLAHAKSRPGSPYSIVAARILVIQSSPHPYPVTLSRPIKQDNHTVFLRYRSRSH